MHLGLPGGPGSCRALHRVWRASLLVDPTRQALGAPRQALLFFSWPDGLPGRARRHRPGPDRNAGRARLRALRRRHILNPLVPSLKRMGRWLSAGDGDDLGPREDRYRHGIYVFLPAAWYTTRIPVFVMAGLVSLCGLPAGRASSSLLLLIVAPCISGRLRRGRQHGRVGWIVGGSGLVRGGAWGKTSALEAPGAMEGPPPPSRSLSRSSGSRSCAPSRFSLSHVFFFPNTWTAFVCVHSRSGRVEVLGVTAATPIGSLERSGSAHASAGSVGPPRRRHILTCFVRDAG